MNNKNLCIYFLSSLLTVRGFCHMSCGTSLLTWLCVCLANFTRGTFVTIGQQRVLVGNSIIFMLTITHNCKQKSCFLFLSIPAVGFKSSLVPKPPQEILVTPKSTFYCIIMLSLGCASIYIIFIVFPLWKYQIIMHFTIFCQVMMLWTLDKMDRNRLLKDNTSLEAVTLIEENDNEVFKLLNYEYI